MKFSVVLAMGAVALTGCAEAFVSKVTSNAYVNSYSLVGVEYLSVHSDTFTGTGTYQINLPTTGESTWSLDSCFLAQNYNNEAKRRAHLIKSSMKRVKDTKTKEQYIEGSFDIGEAIPRGDFRIQCIVKAPKQPIVLDATVTSNASSTLSFNNSLSSTPGEINHVTVREYTSIGNVKLSGSGLIDDAGDKGFIVNIRDISGSFRSIVIDSSGELAFSTLNQPSPLCNISGDDIAANAALVEGSTDKLLINFTAPTTKGKNYKITCKGIAVAKTISGYPVLATVVGTDSAVEYKGFNIVKMENNAAARSFAAATVLVVAVLAFVF